MFNEENVKAIIDSTESTAQGNKTEFPKTPVPKALADDLNLRLDNCQGWQSGWKSISTKKQISNQINDSIKKTEKVLESYNQTNTELLKLLQIDPSTTISNTVEMLDEAQHSLDLITDHLADIAGRVSTDDHRALKRGGIEPKTDFIGRALPEVYKKHFGKEAKISRPDSGGEPSGPTIRFINACLDVLGHKTSSENIKSAIDTCRKAANTNGEVSLIYSDRGSARIEKQGGGGGLPAPRIDYPLKKQWKFVRREHDDSKEPNKEDALRLYTDAANYLIKESGYWDNNLKVWGAYLIELTAKGDKFGVSNPSKSTAARINIHLYIQAHYHDEADAFYDSDDDWED